MKRILFSTICVCIALTSFNQIPEIIDRGVVALTVEENSIYVGWRLLLDDPEDAGFNIYRKDIGFGDYEKVNAEPVKGSTNYLDGINPSLIMQRGTYTVIKTVALDQDLQPIWKWESIGKDEKYKGQGGHAIICMSVKPLHFREWI